MTTQQVVNVIRHSKVGRPVVNEVKPVLMPTRIPTELHPRLKMLTLMPTGKDGIIYGSEARMYSALFNEFLEERPFDGGAFTWQNCGSIRSFSMGMVERTSWKQMNVQVPPELSERINKCAAEQGRSNAAFMYSALVWWLNKYEAH